MIKDRELQRSQMFLCGAQYDVEPLLLTGCEETGANIPQWKKTHDMVYMRL